MRRRSVALALASVALAGVGCDTHTVTVGHRCPSPATTKVVVASERGAVGMAKLGFTPRALRAIKGCE
jgi:hypothetical protein